MRPWRFLLFILLISFTFEAFPAVFVVTSNADSGPGTLREALTKAAANGSTEIDYINFNLSGTSETDRTIGTLTPLPDITGNVIIDGTSQPGFAFGLSNAKVIVTAATPGQGWSVFNINAESPDEIVQFYGLYIKASFYEFGINVNAECKLTIGAPGKGNVFCDSAIGVFGNLTNTTIQSNFFGIMPDGETLLPNYSSAIAAGHSFNNLLVGGDSPQEGNLIGSQAQEALYFGNGALGSKDQLATIKNNNFGVDYTGTKSLTIGTSSFIRVNDADRLIISQNVFSANVSAIEASNNAQLLVTGNYFGTNRTQTITFGAGGSAINIGSNAVLTIGGTAAADQNVFTSYNNPIFTLNSPCPYVIKNSFYCNGQVTIGNDLAGNFVRIIKLLDNEVSGVAPPGADVQLYYTTSNCTNCNPVTWFATVKAGANGVWDYKGDTRQNIMVSSTVNNSTIGFQPFTVAKEEVKINNVDCNHQGLLELIQKREGRFKFIWKDDNGKIWGTGQKIENLPVGHYTLQISEGANCPIATGDFYVTDDTPVAFGSGFALDCDKPTASFSAQYQIMHGYTAKKFTWTKEDGTVFSHEKTVSGLTAGKYYLYVTDSNGCTSDKALYIVAPIPVAPTIDESKIVVTDADCDFGNGSVTGITFSTYDGSTFGWRRTDGSIISYYELDLKNVPAGQYYFFVNFNSSCPPVKTRMFTIKAKNAISIDESAVIKTVASCNKNNGSISGIKQSNGSSFVWKDLKGNEVGHTLDLSGVATGDYSLTVTNIYGCSKTSAVYHVEQQLPMQLPQYTATTVASCFGGKTGSVTIATDALVKTLRWVDGQGAPAGDQPALTNVGAGTYKLYITDQNGCENLYNTYTIEEVPEFKVASTGQTVNDQCGLNTGNVNNVSITGGVPPYTYKWTDAAGKTIGTESSISNLAAGNYVLNVVDTRCGNVDVPYTITEESAEVAAPSVSDIQLCSSGSALLSVNNASPDITYRLYETENNAHQVDEQKGGKFNINVTANRSYFITQLNGTCESSRVEVKITVGLSTINISNAFTPNEDGINDYWKISNIENYPGALVQVFSRYGQKVFESKGYAKPFDGTMNGKKLSPGVYYYIINLNTNCNVLSGSLTIIR